MARRTGGRLRTPSFAEVRYTVVHHALLPLNEVRRIYIYIYIGTNRCAIPVCEADYIFALLLLVFLRQSSIFNCFSNTGETGLQIGGSDFQHCL